jgi:uncharacterized protein YggE
MRRIFLALLTVMCVCGSTAAQVDRSLITVSGQAEVFVAPDEAVVRFSVDTLDKNLAAAKAANDERIRKVIATARSVGVAEPDVQTDRLDVSPRYSDDDGETRTPRVFLGYAMSKHVVIVVRDVAKIEGLVTGLLEAGVDQIDGVELRSSKLRATADEARALAMRAAREKAVAMAKELGQTVGRAFTIAEEGARDYSFGVNNSGFVSGTTTSGSADSTVATGRISVTARVVVSFVLD